MHDNREITGQLGLFAVAQAVLKLGWFFVPNQSPEYGIDGEIEVTENGSRTGKILKVQIKSGLSYFQESTPNGFVYRGDRAHLRYWLGYAVPVLIVLHNPATQSTYWETVDKDKISSTGTGWKIEIPRAQLLDESSPALLSRIANRMVHARTGGLWTRHQRYEFSRNYVRPASTHDCTEYDPWHLYNSHQKSTAWQPPYISLLNLARQINWTSASGVAPTESSLTADEKASILDWTAKYGLLGLLPGLAQMITLWPRWESRRAMYNSKTIDGACEAYTRYIRMAGTWYSTGMMRDSSVDQVPNQALIIGEPVPKALIPSEWPPPGVLRWSQGLFNWQEEPLSSALGSYFPDVQGSRDLYDYPCPGQPRFWAEYAERVSDFVIWAKNFHDVLMEISEFGSAHPNDVQAVRVNEAMYLLESLASAVSTSIEFEAGTRRFLKKWRSPSLLSSFAMMAIEDIAAGHKFFTCERCHSVFRCRGGALQCDSCA